MKKKILFFGTPEIAVSSLETLAKLNDIEIVGVGVFPDKTVGRKKVLTKCPVKIKAEELGLPIIEISNKSDLVKTYNSTKFDLAIVIAFGIIFPAEILHDGKFLNVHFSLLPKYRGASPVQSAILNNEQISGISFQKMVYELDAGDIIWQKKYNIENKTTSELWHFFAQETASNLPTFLIDYFSNKISPTKQDQKQASFCGKFSKADGEIFLEKDSAKIVWRKYLAFDFWPGIFINTIKGNLKLTKISNTNLANSYELKCANDSTIYITKGQLAGKNEMAIGDILRGNGDIFKTN